MTGGTSADTLDPDATVTNVDWARAFSMFDSLITLDLNAQLQLQLAEEMTANSSATVWTIRLRPDVTFHNGKPLQAEDVIFSLRRILDPKNPLEGASQIASIDYSGMRALDSLTVQLQCHTPFSSLPETLATPFFFIVPVGFDVKNPIGTGAFKFGTFTAGVQSTYPRYENYWRHPLPYVDELVITDYADETSQLDALLSGVENAIALLSAASISPVKSGGQQLVISRAGGYVPFTMRVDQPPFSDNRVREAMRLIVDRQQLLDLVFEGNGIIGNDIFSIFDPAYDHALPQRTQDIPKAKSLLKAAGYDNLHLTFVASPVAQGAVQAAEVFAQQAAAAAVTVSISQVTPTVFYGPNYLSWKFALDYWSYTPYLPQVAQAMLPTSPFNETHFDDPQYNALYNQALATLDDGKRAELIHDMQVIDYTQGAFVIPCFSPVIDAHAPSLEGVVPSKCGLPLSNFGFASMWLS